MGAVGVNYCVKIYPSRLCEVCNRWKMMLSVVLSIGLQLAQDDTEISIRAKTRTNEQYDETSAKGKN